MADHDARIEVINRNSPHLSTVKSLGDANSKTLGFLPEAAFDACAEKGTILAAIAGTTCVGYLLYRVARGRASITHLCVDSSERRRGTARHLVNALVERTRDLTGIGLWCRRDYEASKVWQRLGFAAMAEKPGRSRSGSELTFWWLDHHQPTLFSRNVLDEGNPRIPVAMDACVFFDLIDERSADTEESKSLQADWLCDSIELHLTDETFNEIDRAKDSRQRRRQRGLAQGFANAKHDAARFQEVRESLRHLFPPTMTPSDESDLHQLAKTVAADIPFFVTRAEDLLEKADKLYDKFGLTIIRPSNLIVELDLLRRESEYRPQRMAGSLRKIQLVKSGQENLLAGLFQRDSLGEGRQRFIRQLTAHLASPTKFTCYAAYDEDKAPLALVVYGSAVEGILEIPLMRFARSSLSPTMARYLTQHSILTACKEKRAVVVVTDTYVDQTLADALHESAFVHEGGQWKRVVLDVSESKGQIVRLLESMGGTLKSQAKVFLEVADGLRKTPMSDVTRLSEFEQLLWPAKIVDADIPSFIIPIQPRWAQHLFDEHLAGQELFGARADLALNSEAVYYRAKSRCGLAFPARILWYVSQHDDFSGAGSIRACSRLNEFLVGKPKDLYRQFRRLGVYEWRDVFQLAKRNVNNEIMALRFGSTELLPKTIPWDQMQKILTAQGIRSQIQTVTRTPNELFAALYAKGKQ